jgi:hypothetical protein
MNLSAKPVLVCRHDQIFPGACPGKTVSDSVGCSGGIAAQQDVEVEHGRRMHGPLAFRLMPRRRRAFARNKLIALVTEAGFFSDLGFGLALRNPRFLCFHLCNGDGIRVLAIAYESGRQTKTLRNVVQLPPDFFPLSPFS